MTGPRSPPSRRSLLGSLAAASVGGLAGCTCAAGGPRWYLAVAAAEPPRETDDGWVLDVDVEVGAPEEGAQGLGAARLVVYDGERSLLGTTDLGPFAASNGYEESTEEACAGKRYVYRRTLPILAPGEPAYVNAYVPPSACPDGRVVVEPLVLASAWDPEFRCGQRFPFRVLDVGDAPEGDAADWPTRGFDAARSAYNPAGEAPAGLSGVRWSRAVSDVTPPPVVESGAVYVVPGAGSDGPQDERLQDADVAALSLASGEVAWTGEGADRGVTATEERVYAAGNTVVAWAAATGREQWRVEPEVPAVAPPTFAHERVYVHDAEGTLHAWSADDGREAWSTALGEEGGQLAAGGDALYAVADDVVFALSPATGTVLWERPLGDVTDVLRVGDDAVYLGVDRRPMVLSAADGRELWRGEAPGHERVEVVGDGTVYLRRDDEVLARSADDGSVRWRTHLADVPRVSGLVGGRLYVMVDGSLVVLDPATGDRVSGVDVDDDLASVVVAGGTALAVTADGELQAFEAG